MLDQKEPNSNIVEALAKINHKTVLEEGQEPIEKVGIRRRRMDRRRPKFLQSVKAILFDLGLVGGISILSVYAIDLGVRHVFGDPLPNKGSLAFGVSILFLILYTAFMESDAGSTLGKKRYGIRVVKNSSQE